MKQKNAALYNLLTVTFLVLTACICLVTVSWMVGVGVPGPIAPKTIVPVPTLQSLSTPLPLGASPEIPTLEGPDLTSAAPVNPGGAPPSVPPMVTPTPES